MQWTIVTTFIYSKLHVCERFLFKLHAWVLAFMEVLRNPSINLSLDCGRKFTASDRLNLAKIKQRFYLYLYWRFNQSLKSWLTTKLRKNKLLKCIQLNHSIFCAPFLQRIFKLTKMINTKIFNYQCTRIFKIVHR